MYCYKFEKLQTRKLKHKLKKITRHLDCFGDFSVNE